MIRATVSAINIWSGQFWLAQVPEVENPEQASALFEGADWGTQFLIALISGLVLAFAIQLVLTNLSVAVGISYLGKYTDPDASHSNRSSSSSDDDSSGGIGSTIRKISLGVGVWTLITVTIALLISCFLAVKLSLLVSPVLGAITGLVIWGTYFSLLVGISSTTAGSLVGTVVNAATSGFQAILGTAAAAIGGSAVNRQVVSTAEAAASAVRREFGAAVDPVSIRETVEDYLDTLRPTELNMSEIRSEFERMLNDPELRAVAGSDRLQNVDRQTFVDLVSSRTDLSKREVNRIADQLERTWKQTLGQRAQGDRMAELLDYLRSTQQGQLNTEEFNRKIDQLIDEIRQSRDTYSQQGAGGYQSGPGGQSGQSGQSGIAASVQSLQTSLMPLMGMIMGRADISDLNLEKVMDRLKSVQGTAQSVFGEQASKLGSQFGVETSVTPYNTIRADIENYLLNTYAWQMSSEAIARDFRNVLYDPAADPAAVRRQLEQINRSDFIDILASRGLLTQAQLQRIADQLEMVRREVLVTARGAEEREAALSLRQRIETYLSFTPKTQLLSPNDNQRAFRALLEDSEADYETLSGRLAPYTRSELGLLLESRQDILPEERGPILDQLEKTRDQVLSESLSLNEQARQRTEQTWQNLQGYLQNTGRDELNPNAIRNELQVLLNDPQAGMELLRARASHFDRNTLVQLLAQRKDMNEDQASEILNQVESTWFKVTHSPQLLTGQAKQQYDQATSTIADYLRSTGRDELNPEGIQRDLQKLLNDPKAGATALRDRLSRMDRETLVQLLNQRQDLSEEQINQTIDQLQESIRTVLRAPRRLALRAQQQVLDFESTVEEYLRNTDKEELNPEGIKRDLQLLVQDPRFGLRNLGDRLSRFDRNTLVALLSQRKDMTPEEAERVVGQIESVRDQIVTQFRNVQYRIQAVIDGIFARIRNYLNALERPELNYDGIKRDLRTLFNDPQAGFDALRGRLGQVDRGTLVALLSSREDISESDANRIIDQVEGARFSVLQRAERLQQDAQRRLEAAKRQAQIQADETRKAAANAAWWLFATALVSAAASAGAGWLAVL
ncbi:MFS transporter [Leptolyngbya sp. FACHB-541]|uniref:MFS transporter n=1 Tax=Leptolyngbya sp. FACHB-541 TaxID=2692810 RepID=UPI001685828D|nr:MFS transporter [Leptolyngbya sp. FACHB-541]